MTIREGKTNQTIKVIDHLEGRKYQKKKKSKLILGFEYIFLL